MCLLLQTLVILQKKKKKITRTTTELSPGMVTESSVSRPQCTDFNSCLGIIDEMVEDELLFPISYVAVDNMFGIYNEQVRTPRDVPCQWRYRSSDHHRVIRNALALALAYPAQ